jgi:hypothetical protein
MAKKQGCRFHDKIHEAAAFFLPLYCYLFGEMVKSE